MRPVTWQCAGTGWPASIKVPAAMSLDAVMVVSGRFASLALRSAQAPTRAPALAGVSWGTTNSSSSPQPATARIAAATGSQRTSRKTR